MQIRWSPSATDDLDQIFHFIQPDNKLAAQRVVEEIYERAGRLAEHPYMGRYGRIEGTRELALSPLPFVLIYRVADGVVEIARVIHGAQRWPPTG